MNSVVVRAPADADFAALAAMDLRYPATRVLALAREGEAPEHRFGLRWVEREGAEDVVYAEYTAERLRAAVAKVDRFIVAEAAAPGDGRAVGLLMIVVPSWTDAGEITDFAVDRAYRRRGVGRALLDDAVSWGRGRGLRSLWVEPRSDNAEAIEFYVAQGFRLSGFNDRMYSNADHADGRLTLFMHRELRES